MARLKAKPREKKKMDAKPKMRTKTIDMVQPTPTIAPPSEMTEFRKMMEEFTHPDERGGERGSKKHP